jgi:hypothetical protein
VNWLFVDIWNTIRIAPNSEQIQRKQIFEVGGYRELEDWSEGGLTTFNEWMNPRYGEQA